MIHTIVSSPVISGILEPSITFETVLEPNIVRLVPTIPNIIANNETLVFNNRLLSPTIGITPMTVSYPDLNKDVNIQHKVLNNLWLKLLKIWSYDFIKIWSYVTGTKGSYKLVDDTKDADESNQQIELKHKIKWFFNTIYTKKDFLNTIFKYKTYTKLDIWNIDNDTYYLKKFIYHQIRRRIQSYYK